MAGKRTAPADKPPDKYYYKYYKVSSEYQVWCDSLVFCEDPYHFRDFDRLKNTKKYW